MLVQSYSSITLARGLSAAGSPFSKLAMLAKTTVHNTGLPIKGVASKAGVAFGEKFQDRVDHAYLQPMVGLCEDVTGLQILLR